MKIRSTEKHALSEIDEYMASGGTVRRAKSHHRGTSHLKGGDDYRTWKRNLKIAGGLLGAIILIFACYRIALILNVGGVSNAPDAPEASTTEGAFRTSTAPSIANLKYVSTDPLSFVSVDNIKVGRVVSKNGESGYTCSVKADVIYKNTSMQATSRVNATYNYNSVLKTWEASNTEIENTNFTPVAPADDTKIQEDLMSMISEYDNESATKIQGAEISKEGELTEEGGILTFTLTKKESGAETNSESEINSSSDTNNTIANNGNTINDSSGNNTNAQNLPNDNSKTKQDLVETVKIRVAWSDIDGWQANIIWLGTKGESDASQSSDKTKEEGEETEADATMELNCTSGSLVQLEGTVTENQLKTAVTKFTIDGQMVVTSTIYLSGNYTKYSGASNVVGTISTNGSTVTLTIS